MAEKCPKCHSITLGYDPCKKSAKCYSTDCIFNEYVKDRDTYFNQYVISKLNWSNYCNGTPEFVRKIRGHLKPINYKRKKESE